MDAPVAIVTKYPMSGRQLAELERYLDEAAVPSPRAYLATIKCKSEGEPGKTEVRACAPYLLQELAAIRPKGVLAVGGEALLALLGRSGIMKYRARVEQLVLGDDLIMPVMPTISPAMVHRNPGQKAGFIADLEYFARTLTGQDAPTAPPDRLRVVMTGQGLKALERAFRGAQGVVFDIETDRFNEYEPGAVIATASFTVWDGDRVECWGVPLAHPESPFRGKWRKVLKRLRDALLELPKVVAHNGKFDARWMHQFGVPLELTFDTMLAAHLLDENRPKGLKPLAQSMLGVAPWAIDATVVMDTPLRRVIKYNCLDTWYTYHLYLRLRADLLEQPRLAAIMQRLMVPASNVLTTVEREGIWIDRERLATRAKQARETLADIDAQLMEHVPPADEWPEAIRKTGVNFNASNFARWWLFNHLGFPVLARGKAKEDGSPGAPSMAEDLLLKLKADHPESDVIRLMIERIKWQKYVSSFFSAYEELIDDNDHLHTTFKLTGTVTGRLSSGKGDDEKVTGRVSNRGVNLQQVPRDKFIRGLFGAPPGYLFMECDYSQVELRIAAFLAQEPTMLYLYNTGEDIHTAMARQMTGKATPTSDERKKAKAVNFGFLYGMGWLKFIETAWANYGVVVTEAESRAFRRAFFTQFNKLPEWHNRQRSLVAKYKRVESPLGRIRHLPDIDSANEGVKGEAQRQAINSPVQSFASDMCLLSLVRLDRELKRRGLTARSVGTVHDAINFVVPVDEVTQVVPLVRQVMENLPLKQLFGVELNVPIVADVKLGRYWGDALELDNEVSSNPKALKQFIRGHKETLGL